MVSKGLDREQRQGRIVDARMAIKATEEELGTAVLDGDDVHQTALRDERDHQRTLIEDEEAAIAILERRIAEDSEAAQAREIERQRMELYQCYAGMLPIRAEVLRTHKAYLEAQKALQDHNQSSRLNPIRNSLVSARISYEYPSGPRADGSDDADAVELEAQRFRSLAAEIRARLED